MSWCPAGLNTLELNHGHNTDPYGFCATPEAVVSSEKLCLEAMPFPIGAVCARKHEMCSRWFVRRTYRIQHASTWWLVSAAGERLAATQFTPAMRGLYLSFCLAAVANAAQVYIYPRPKSLPNGIPPAHASSVIAYHLQLEEFEPAKDTQILTKYFSHHGGFVGSGIKSSLLLRVDEDDARGALFTYSR